MTIQGVGGTPPIQKSYIESIEQTKDVSGSGIIEGGGVLSIENIKDGEIFGPPQLPPPGEFSSEDANNMINNLENIATDDTLKNLYELTSVINNIATNTGDQNVDNPLLGSSSNSGNNKETSTDSGTEGGSHLNLDKDSLLGDIEQLLVLMQKLFQSQKKAARESRHAEYQLQQKEISAQADKLREAAWTVLSMGIASAAMTVAFSGIGSGKSAKAFKATKQNIKLSHDINTVQSFKNCKNNIINSQNKIDSLNTKITQTKNSINNIEANIEANKTKMKNVDSKLENINKEIDSLQSRKDSLSDAELRKLNDLQKQKTNLESKKSSLEAENKKLSEHKKGLEEELNNYNNELQNAKQDLARAKEDMGKLLESLSDKDIDTIAKTDDAKLAKMKEKSQELSAMAEDLSRDADIKRLMGQVIGQVLMSSGQAGSMMQQADATEHEGKAKLHEQRAQDETEWMQNMRDLIKTAQDALRMIQQSQIDTERTIASHMV
ncbi:CT398-like coiled coil hairpin domain-containing protein [Desulfothermus sp.]